MTIFRIFNNTYVNPSNVGRMTFEVLFTDESRISVTTLFDLQGQIIDSIETVVTLSTVSDNQAAVKKDNFFHEEIIASIKEGRDARKPD